MEESEIEIKFKKKKKGNIRKRIEDDEDNDPGVDLKKLNDLKELREFKCNQLRGLSAEELLNLKIEKNDKLKKISLNSLNTNPASNVDLGNTFSAETNRRDEDADMLKFIEEELARRRKGEKQEVQTTNKVKSNPKNIDEIVFNDLPEHLLNTNKNKNEEMLSTQMLNGIPEIDLGLDEKIRNIEATEEAKRKAAIVQVTNKSIKETSFVPNNMAANYVQHNKFNISDHNSGNSHQNKKQKIEPVKLIKEPVVVIGDEPKESVFKVRQETGERTLKHPGREQASDNYHFERFKKSFRK